MDRTETVIWPHVNVWPKEWERETYCCIDNVIEAMDFSKVKHTHEPEASCSIR